MLCTAKPARVALVYTHVPSQPSCLLASGCLVSCFLLFSGLCGSAGEAIRLFGEIRTEDGEVHLKCRLHSDLHNIPSQGVTIPSQRRYVKYFELHQINPRMPRALLLKSFYINIFPAVMFVCPYSKSHAV